MIRWYIGPYDMARLLGDSGPVRTPGFNRHLPPGGLTSAAVETEILGNHILFKIDARSNVLSRFDADPDFIDVQAAPLAAIKTFLQNIGYTLAEVDRVTDFRTLLSMLDQVGKNRIVLNPTRDGYTVTPERLPLRRSTRNVEDAPTTEETRTR